MTLPAVCVCLITPSLLLIHSLTASPSLQNELMTPLCDVWAVFLSWDVFEVFFWSTIGLLWSATLTQPLPPANRHKDAELSAQVKVISDSRSSACLSGSRGPARSRTEAERDVTFKMSIIDTTEWTELSNELHPAICRRCGDSGSSSTMLLWRDTFDRQTFLMPSNRS